MRAISYLMLGVVGTLAYQRITENQPMLSRQMRKMMKNNSKSIRKIREIF